MHIHVKNNYSRIKSILLCRPDNFQVIDPYHEQADIDRAKEQYQAFVAALTDAGVSLSYLPMLPDCPGQVFTQDLGFVVGKRLFISSMSEPLRLEEPRPLKELARQHGWSTYEVKNPLEGGDVILHDYKLFIGQSDRTCKQAIEEVAQELTNSGSNIKVVPVVIDVDKIHLDCVFNVLDKDTCLLTPGVLNPEAIHEVFPKVLIVDGADADSLGVNIVNLGDVILCSNGSVTEMLKENGYNASFVEYNEFIKASGSIGCCVLPLERI